MRALWGSNRALALPLSNGASALTTILALVGLAQLVRRPNQRTLAILLLAPFVLNFLAALMHKYPYGGCCRLAQHLAPAICMMAGWGLAWGVERSARSALSVRRVAFMLLAVSRCRSSAWRAIFIDPTRTSRPIGRAA
jgi:hypothetical protein